jgi:tRNA pseudouridine38-40 synthase
MRVRMDIAYDGSEFSGWQRQTGHRTVQEDLESAISRVAGEQVVVFGSGRTDAGVHARGQVAHIDLQDGCDLVRLMRGVNAVLARDVRVMRMSRARPEFHAQFSAMAKEYRYFIWNGAVMPPLDRRTRAHVRDPLDVAAMRKAALMLVGRHDFAAFTANPNREVETTVRELLRLEVHKRGSLIEIRALGRGFLYKMVRSLAGFLIRVGQGAEKPETASSILGSRLRTARVPTAAPQGLFLWKVFYKQVSCAAKCPCEVAISDP